MKLDEFIERYPKLITKKPFIIFAAYKCCVHCRIPIELVLFQDGVPKFYGFKNERLVLFTIDHVIPKSKDGTDELSNLQALCKPCNQRKGDDLEPQCYSHRFDIIPPDFYHQIKRHQEDKKMRDEYPDWRPYYGL